VREAVPISKRGLSPMGTSEFEGNGAPCKSKLVTLQGSRSPYLSRTQSVNSVVQSTTKKLRR
jgi:hypothetical protein